MLAGFTLSSHSYQSIHGFSLSLFLLFKAQKYLLGKISRVIAEMLFGQVEIRSSYYLSVCVLASGEEKERLRRPWMCDLGETRFPVSLTLVGCGPQLRVSRVFIQSEQAWDFDILGMILLKVS